MALIHKAVKKNPSANVEGSRSTAPVSGGATRTQLDDDEALARALQAEMDAEDASQSPSAPPTSHHSSPSHLSSPSHQSNLDDEAIARQLQLEYDLEEERAVARERDISMQQQRSPQRQSPVSASKQAGSPGQIPSSPVSGGGASSRRVNPFGNLLSEPVSSLHPESTWTSRQRKLASLGTKCMKVDRHGRKATRTFWMRDGYLTTDGKTTRQVAVGDLRSVFRGNGSEEFEKLANS